MTSLRPLPQPVHRPRWPAGAALALLAALAGQQRLSTLALTISALLDELPPSDSTRIAHESILLRQAPGGPLKLHFGNNKPFVEALLCGKLIPPTSGGQRKLLDVYNFLRDRAKAISSVGGVSAIGNWLAAIKTLDMIEFVASDNGRAIRFFQTIVPGLTDRVQNLLAKHHKGQDHSLIAEQERY